MKISLQSLFRNKAVLGQYKHLHITRLVQVQRNRVGLLLGWAEDICFLVILQYGFSAIAELNRKYSSSSKPKSLENNTTFLSPKWIVGSPYSLPHRSSNRTLSKGLNFASKKLVRSCGVIETIYDLFPLYSNMVSSRRLEELFGSVV